MTRLPTLATLALLTLTACATTPAPPPPPNSSPTTAASPPAHLAPTRGPASSSDRRACDQTAQLAAATDPLADPSLINGITANLAASRDPLLHTDGASLAEAYRLAQAAQDHHYQDLVAKLRGDVTAAAAQILTDCRRAGWTPA